jgi:hypothetical protein
MEMIGYGALERNENTGRTISFLNILHRLIFLSLLYLPAQLPYLPGIAL